jgi:Cys-tRNA(Pro)/Cys-tRNA(Cys) deacylase
MKKRFPTYFHTTALDQDVIYVSAGVRGLQIEISPQDLINFVQAKIADVGVI